MTKNVGLRVFLCWSGPRSQRVAETLREWLSDVMQDVVAWMSEEDIQAGARWNNELQQELAGAEFGVLCLTPENVSEPWILFEAGALANQVSSPMVCPYLAGGLKKAEIPKGPLAQFQAKLALKEETWDMVVAINSGLGEVAQGEVDLKRRFETNWPRLQGVLANLPAAAGPVRSRRPEEDVLSEVLVAVRRIEQLMETQVVETASAQSAQVDDGVRLSSKALFWGHVIQAVKRRKRILGSFLEEVAPVGIIDGSLLVAADKVHASVIGMPENAALIEEELRRALGRPVRLRLLDPNDPTAQTPPS